MSVPVFASGCEARNRWKPKRKPSEQRRLDASVRKRNRRLISQTRREIMAGTAKVDDKTGKLISADLGVDYAGHLAAVKAEVSRDKKLNGKVERALMSLGITNRPLKESDQKKLAAAPNAEDLIKEFETIGKEISGNYIAYDGQSVRDAEKKACEALAKELVKETAENVKEVKQRIAELEKYLKSMEIANKEVESEIEKLTKNESVKFFKTLAEYSVESKEISIKYGNTWDFSVAKKILKKK